MNAMNNNPYAYRVLDNLLGRAWGNAGGEFDAKVAASDSAEDALSLVFFEFVEPEFFPPWAEEPAHANCRLNGDDVLNGDADLVVEVTDRRTMQVTTLNIALNFYR